MVLYVPGEVGASEGIHRLGPRVRTHPLVLQEGKQFLDVDGELGAETLRVGLGSRRTRVFALQRISIQLGPQSSQ